MTSFFRRHVRVALTWAVVGLLTVDTATACRFFAARRSCWTPCQPVICCWEEVTCCDRVVVENGCCASPGVVQPGSGGWSEVPPAPPTEAPPAPEPAPDVQPAPADIPPAPPLEPAPAFPTEPAPETTVPELSAEPAPAPRQPMPADDLFGEKPTVPETPAEPAPADDLFGAPKPSDMPTEPPATEPAPAKPKESLDDLFGAPQPAESKPEAAQPAPVDDLFGTPPAAAPATPPKDSVDDLFGTEPKPAADAPSKPAATPIDPFGSIQKRANDLLVARLWIDNTGNFSVRGRLIAVLDGKVRLLKENGRTCTVPMRRLSRADAEYVQGVVAQLGTGVLVQLASK